MKSQNTRFSINKLTGDIGEYYAMKALHVPFYFDEIIQSRNSNSPFDIEVRISDNC
jgi:hypothetical protein